MHCHIAATKACFAADLGVRTICVDAQAGEVMAGLGEAAGPAQDVQHQRPGKTYSDTVNIHIIA